MEWKTLTLCPVGLPSVVEGLRKNTNLPQRVLPVITILDWSLAGRYA